MAEKMNPVVKEEWVKALRSGDYKQARGQLRTEKNAFCCLGVLCNIHAQNHPEVAMAEDDQEVYLGNYTNLPEEVMDWSGLSGHTMMDDSFFAMPFTIRGTGFPRTTFAVGTECSLMDLNDEGCNFRQIADIIEAVL